MSCGLPVLDIAPCGCRVTGPSDYNLGPVARHPQGAGFKQLKKMWLHAMALPQQESGTAYPTDWPGVPAYEHRSPGLVTPWVLRGKVGG